MSTKNALYGLLALTIVFVIGLYFFVFSSGINPEDPEYNFIYAEYEFGDIEKIEYDENSEGLIVIDCFDLGTECSDQVAIFEYDVSNEESIELTIAQLQDLEIDEDRVAPDGYEYHDFYSNPFGFGSSSSNNNVLEQDGYIVRTDINENFRNNIQFIGWVIN